MFNARGVARWVLPVLAALLLLAVGFGVGATASRAEAADVTRTQFTDNAGRVCVQLRAYNAVALDCDFPPAENRLGDALDGLVNP